MRFFIADEDGAVLDFEDAVIRDGDFEDVRGKVFEAGLSGRDSLGVNVPVDEPDFRGDLIEEAGFYHLIAECSCAASTEGWEEKTWMAVGEPIAAQELKSGLGQWDVAILGALAAVDMDHHAGAIDIGDFEMKSLVQAQAAGIDGGQIGVVVEGFDVG